METYVILFYSFFVVVILLFLLYKIYDNKVYKRIKNENDQFAPKAPFLSSAPFWSQRDTLKQYRYTYGSLYFCYRGLTPTLCISEPSLINEVFGY